MSTYANTSCAAFQRFLLSPVVQLSRMPTSIDDSKVAKKKTELINAIDILSSHLHTTFRALSTAFAISSSADPASQPGPLAKNAQAHMAIVLGAAVGAPKARVMLVMTGLKVSHLGVATSSAQQKTSEVTTSATGSSDGKEDERVDDEESESESEQESDEESEYYTDEAEESSDESPATPPRSDSSRSASPSPSEPDTALDPSTAFMEEQQALRTADRLLSRTLASACAESDGGLSSELGTCRILCLCGLAAHVFLSPYADTYLITSTKAFQPSRMDATAESHKGFREEFDIFPQSCNC